MGIDATAAKLRALLKSTRGLFIGTPVAHDYEEVASLYARYASIRDRLRERYPDLYGDVPIRDAPTPREAAGVRSSRIDPGHALDLAKDIEYCLDLLTGIPGDTALPKATREGVFLAGEPFDAMMAVNQIVSTAAVSIDIIDGYIGPSTLNLLTGKDLEVGVRILTKKLEPATSEAIKRFKDQYGHLQVRTSDSFHDRFVIIDGAEIYHFGASIKDLGRRGFMFSKIEEPLVTERLLAAFEEAWSSAAEE